MARALRRGRRSLARSSPRRRARPRPRPGPGVGPGGGRRARRRGHDGSDAGRGVLMPGELATIAFEQAERAAVVRIEGEVDMSNADRFLDELMTRVGVDPWLIVDLSACSYVDSAGLSVIARVEGRCREVGAGLRLVVEAESGVDRVLAMTRLHEMLNVDRTLGEAVESARQESPDRDRAV